MENLNLFFSRIKEITFWQRLFSWGRIKSLSYDAFEEFRALAREAENTKAYHEELKNRNTELSTINKTLEQKIKDQELLYTRKSVQDDTAMKELSGINAEMQRKISFFEATAEKNRKDQELKIAEILQAKEVFEKEKLRVQEEKERQIRLDMENMKKQWADHETDVRNAIIRICDTHHVTYVDKVPFRGNPDNTIEICDEYIVFDAKSPANDNLSNFPAYIRAQTESVRKYASQDNVRKSIFLVVPTNTIDTLKQVTYRLGDYDVFVITKDSLEPVILSLKKIEEYELAEKLSPEDRDSICRIIGKFAHTVKRRIEVDNFFTDQFLDIVIKSQKELPEDIQTRVIEFEKSEKLNPPTEKRSKLISIEELQKKSNLIKDEAARNRLAQPEEQSKPEKPLPG